MTITLALVVACALEAAVAMAAYHRGRRHGRVTLPAAIVRELREHKLRCLGESPDRVELEIALLCDAERSHARSHPVAS